MADADSPKEHLDSEDVGLALLGLASGSMNALAFFNLGEVFPSAMTGNTALLGLALGQGDVIAASRPGFLAGAAVAAASNDLWFDKLPAPRAVCWFLTLEACLLAAFALAWQFIGRPIAGAGLYGFIDVATSVAGRGSRRHCRSPLLAWGVDRLFAICGRCRGGGLPPPRRPTERE